jgi:hypothetical protein
MEQPGPARPATAREIILEIVRNMHDGLEPLHYSTLPPAIYHVYLHADDLDRLRGILPRIVEEACQALNAEVAKLNQASLAARLKISRRNEPKIAPPDGGWQIRILENTDDGTEPGDIVIHSELAVPTKAEFGDGAVTKRIATRRTAGAPSTSKSTYEPAAAPAAAPAGTTYAVIEYDDNTGHKTYHMDKESIKVGRGGRGYWTDIALDTLPDVSREHFSLRRDASSGQFFLTDVSRLGTTINGETAPARVETPLPAEAKIGLAGVVFLDFKAEPQP